MENRNAESKEPIPKKDGLFYWNRCKERTSLLSLATSCIEVGIHRERGEESFLFWNEFKRLENKSCLKPSLGTLSSLGCYEQFQPLNLEDQTDL